MKRFTSAVIVAVLLWTSGPLPALGQTVAAGTGKVSAPTVQGAGANVLRGVAGVPAGNLAHLGSPAFSPTVGLPGLAAPQVQVSGAEFLPRPAGVTAGIQPVSLPVPVVPVSLWVPAAEPSASKPAAVEGKAAVVGEGKKADSSVRALRDMGADLAERGSGEGGLDSLFDGNTTGKSQTVEPSLSGSVSPSRSKDRLELVKSGPITASPEAQAPAPEKAKGSMPFSYYLYLAGQYLYALGQEATSLIAPLYAYAAQGLAFAVTTQAAFLVAILPGSLLGSKWVKRFDAKKVYVAGNILHGLVALSVPIAHVLTGVFSPIHFLVSNVVAGFIYGALRGVAEKEIAPRIVGQENRDRLNKAGALFYAAFEGAELTAALTIAALIPLLGLNPAAAIMSGMMLLSALPLALMKLKKEGSAGGEDEKGGTESRLPRMLYLPYIFTVFSHLSLYMFLAPFLALEVFKSQALNGTIVAFYTVGSLVVALATAYIPRFGKALTERGWAAVGIGTMVAFLAASLLFQSVPMTLGASFLLGVGLTAMQIQWRSLYQQRLTLEAQPHVFKWLSIVPVLATLPPFAFMQAGLFMGWSMPVLLSWLAVAITAVSLGVPFFAWLAKRFPRKKA
ncbi:MAG: MFS transporter [Elusimicrobia bacterium]|nr:MFS transporter [Elusimicrobiota bacterium]